MNEDKELTPSIERLFVDAFPAAERRPLEWFRRLLREEPAVHLATEDERVMLCYWQFPTFIYVEYLAVDASLRGKGIGGRVIRQLVEDSDVPVILEVEPPADDMARRRVAFYERQGFTLLPDRYMQPSYGMEPGMALRLMLCVKDAGMHVPAVDEMVKTIHERVYEVK